MSYAKTRKNFIARVTETLPPVLHSSPILDKVGDAYPDLHIAGREFVCDLDSHDEIIRKTNALTDGDIKIIVLSFVPDAIVSESHDHDDADFQISQREADEIMTLAREIDPTDSNIAAEIRDAIRDNIDTVTV